MNSACVSQMVWPSQCLPHLVTLQLQGHWHRMLPCSLWQIHTRSGHQGGPQSAVWRQRLWILLGVTKAQFTIRCNSCYAVGEGLKAPLYVGVDMGSILASASSTCWVVSWTGLKKCLVSERQHLWLHMRECNTEQYVCSLVPRPSRKV